MREWDQREAEYRLRNEYRDRQGRLFREKQAIRLDVLASEVDVLDADTIRWTAWYNLQLARLDILRATELLLDYIEKAGIAAVPAIAEDTPKPGHRHGWLRRLVQLDHGDTSDGKDAQQGCLCFPLPETGLIAVARRGAGAAAGAQSEARIAPLVPEPPPSPSQKALLRPGETVTLRVRQIIPSDGLSAGERLLSGRPPIAKGDRVLAEVVRTGMHPPALVGGTIAHIAPPGDSPSRAG